MRDVVAKARGIGPSTMSTLIPRKGLQVRMLPELLRHGHPAAHAGSAAPVPVAGHPRPGAGVHSSHPFTGRRDRQSSRRSDRGCPAVGSENRFARTVPRVGRQVVTRPFLEGDLAVLAGLFAGSWSTRHCWCTAFCSTRRQFSLGWFGGGNARHFAAMVARDSIPMGVLAVQDEQVIGWCACGPRSRYVVAATPRTRTLRDRPTEERARVWFVPCFFVKDGYRGRGVTFALARAAVDLARREGAVAIEGSPLSTSAGHGDGDFAGFEEVFAAAGFSRVARPTTDRVIMRLDL